MFLTQTLFIIGSFLVYLFVLVFLVKSFNPKLIKYCLALVIPLLLFTLGFIMRVSNNKPLVDLGYFLTESAGLFVYIIFALTFLLGQLKYWKK